MEDLEEERGVEMFKGWGDEGWEGFENGEGFEMLEGWAEDVCGLLLEEL